MTAKVKAVLDSIQVVSTLKEAASVDTVYWDVYLERARELLGDSLPLEAFQRLEQKQAELADLQLKVSRALESSNWPLVKELSARMQSLRQTVEDKRSLIDTARDVYAVTEVPLDPFSPGMQDFIRLPSKDLTVIRTRMIEQLRELEEADASWREFYAGRRAAFEALAVAATEQKSGAAPAVLSAADARKAAVEALKQGDMRKLERLADAVMEAGAALKAPAAPQAAATSTAAASEQPSADILFTYSEDTVGRARRLGLAPRHLESRTEFATLRQYAWNPLFSSETGRIDSKEVPLPEGAQEGFRERLEKLMFHPIVNSGGARHLPKLVAEDLLVEDFPDLKDGDQPAASELLKALGLSTRRGLSRRAIEQALLANGFKVVGKELGLDPRAFRLVCIPPDVHLRLGETEGWGKQPHWTHFDGYLVSAGGRLRALAGGDVRFGGLFDLLGLDREYDSDRLVARFAVVRRERMVAW